MMEITQEIQQKIDSLIEEGNNWAKSIDGNQYIQNASLNSIDYSNPIFANKMMNQDIINNLKKIPEKLNINNSTIEFKEPKVLSDKSGGFRQYQNVPGNQSGVDLSIRGEVYAPNSELGTTVGGRPYLPGHPTIENPVKAATENTRAFAHETFETLAGKRKDIDFLRNNLEPNSKLDTNLWNNLKPAYEKEIYDQSMILRRAGGTRVSHHHGPDVLVNEIGQNNTWDSRYGQNQDIHNGLFDSRSSHIRNNDGQYKYIENLTGVNKENINNDNVDVISDIALEKIPLEKYQYYSESPTETLENEKDFFKRELRNNKDNPEFGEDMKNEYGDMVKKLNNVTLPKNYLFDMKDSYRSYAYSKPSATTPAIDPLDSLKNYFEQPID